MRGSFFGSVQRAWDRLDCLHAASDANQRTRLASLRIQCALAVPMQRQTSGNRIDGAGIFYRAGEFEYNGDLCAGPVARSAG